MKAITKQPVEVSAVTIDRTSSMSLNDISPTRLEAAQAAALEFIQRKRILDARDVSTVVAFSTAAHVVSRFGRHPFEVSRDIRALTAAGSTNVTAGLRTSYGEIMREAGRHGSATRRVILLTDGEHNTGPGPREDGILDMLCREGVIVDCILAGNDVQGGHLLQEIAKRTGGEFLHVRDFQELLAHYKHLAGKKPASP